jgi:eukaryotic-like serine/threonine-protein kinase
VTGPEDSHSDRTGDTVPPPADDSGATAERDEEPPVPPPPRPTPLGAQVLGLLLTPSVSGGSPILTVKPLSPTAALTPVGEPPVPPAIPGYEVIEELGRGGMGVVYKARQLGLNRTVALKMVLAGAHADPELLARFRSEAEAGARLRHPNIVQIYEVGAAAGLPFLALEYVGGGSLARWLGGTPLPPRAAAGLVETLARAVQTAHEQGIVHRDLKPANILLDGPGPRPTDPGTPKVADFGLAKLLDEEDSRTRTGAVLGTPSYMAPEQALGRTGDVGPAADVYALGAILYECLVGRPPFKAASAVETLEQVRSQEPVPPRRLQPAVPRDLDTVCLKCLSKEASRRYATAAELADDLARFGRGEPVRARPVGAGERVVKWVRRSPAVAGLTLLSVVALLGLLVGGGVYTVLLRRARDRAEVKEVEANDEREAARRARRRAEENYQKALDAVQRFLTRVGESRLAEVPAMEGVRQELLQDALEFYQGLARQDDDPDPRVRREITLAHKRVANLQDMLGRRAAAEENYRQALARFEALAGERADATAWADLAGIVHDLSVHLLQSGRREEGLHYCRRAYELFDQLHVADPGNAEYRDHLATCAANLGITSDDVNQGAEWLARAVRLREELLHDQPESAIQRYSLAMAHLNFGSHWQLRGQLAKAAPEYRQAADLLDRLVADNPRSPGYRDTLARVCINLGLLDHQTNQFSRAEATFRRAADLLQELTREYPGVTAYPTLLGPLLSNHGNLLRDMKRPRESLRAYDRAISVLNEVRRRDPRNAAVALYLRNAHGSRAGLLASLGRWTESAMDWDRVIAVAAPSERNAFRLTRALILGLSGNARRTAAEAEALAAVFHESPKELCDVAAAFALASAAPGKAGADAERWATWAVTLLRRAKDKGVFKDPAAVRELSTRKEFGSLRSRADFRQLWWEISYTGP